MELDDTMKRIIAVSAAVIVLLICMPRRKSTPPPPVAEPVSVPVTSAAASSEPVDEVDSDTIKTLIEADKHFLKPQTGQCTKHTSPSYPDHTVATLQSMNCVTVVKDGTVSMTSNGFLNDPSTR